MMGEVPTLVFINGFCSEYGSMPILLIFFAPIQTVSLFAQFRHK